jgi:hypothetical protein
MQRRLKRGNPGEKETLAVIEAEIERRLKGKPSQMQVSQQFWTELAPEKRYSRYRSTVRNHNSKINARLRKLIS